MSIGGILMIVWYSLKPWLWLIALLLIVLVAAQGVARLQGYTLASKGGIGSKVLPPIAFIAAFFLVPWFTVSSIAYVNTWVDWAALTGAAVAIAIYVWLILHPLCYWRQQR